MVLSVKAAAGASYYFQPWGSSDAPRSSHGVWLRAPAGLGLEKQNKALRYPKAVRPEVTLADLHRLLHRQTADGGESPTFSRKTHSSGYDFVFSAPKSVSIAWALTPKWRPSIEEAHERAVAAAVDVLAEHVIAERVGKGGQKLRHADAAIAAFFHYRCRPARHGSTGEEPTYFADPNLHTHVVVPDIVVSRSAPNERRLKVAYTALYRRWIMALGAWYHAHLAFELRQIGFAVAPTATNDLRLTKGNGLFQVEALDPSVISAFSARTQGARDLQRTATLQHPIETNRLARKSREAALHATKFGSQATGLEADEQHWFAHAKRLKLGLPLRDGAPAADTHHQNDRGERKLFFDRWSDLVEELTRQEAILQRPDLYRGIAALLVAEGRRLQPTERMVTALIGHEDLVRLQPTASYNFPQWTSKATIRDEERVVDLALALSTEGYRQAEPQRSQGSLSWTDAQWRAICRAAGGDRLVLLTGLPGSGKTSLLGPVAAAYRALDPNIRIVAAAEAWKTALSLRDSCGDETYALAALFEKERHGRITIDENCILVVDEVGLLSTRRMLQLLQLARRTNAKLILLGDSAQLSPIGAGSGLELVSKVVGSIQLDEVMRHSTSAQHRLVDALVAVAVPGPDDDPQDRADAFTDLAHVFQSENSWTSSPRSRDAIQEVANRVAQGLAISDVGAGSLVALTRSHREAHHVNRIVRAILRDRGQIDNADTALNAVTPNGIPYRLKITKGDHVRFQTRLRKHKIFNGTQGIVRGVNATSLRVQICDPSLLDKTRIVSIAIADLKDTNGRVQLGCDYASTVFGSQGATFDEVVVLKARSMQFRELYVALTRARVTASVVDVHPERAASHLDQFPGNARDKEERKRLHSLTRDLFESKRRDRPPRLAWDAVQAARRNTVPSRAPWLWDTLVLERQAI